MVAQGKAKDIMANPNSLTGQYLSGKKSIPLPTKYRPGNGQVLTIIRARQNNLQNLTVNFPLGKFIAVTGVSGSGKSTLITETLGRALKKKFYQAADEPGAYDRLEGVGNINKIIEIDQSPIGRTPRSNPATYTGAFTPIRELFASLPEAKLRGYKAGRFSFNVVGGRCEACHGDGLVKIEMQFLPDIYVTCDECHGSRFKEETLEVEYKGKNISQILDLTVDEAIDFFKNIPKLKRNLETIQSVGLGYLELGQPSNTLSGGESQRLKISRELVKKENGRMLYILDEPTTGLHFQDIEKLLQSFDALIEKGHSVVVVEHNLDIIRRADWIIDLGPDAGDKGGELVFEGTPEMLALHPELPTGAALAGEFRN